MAAINNTRKQDLGAWKFTYVHVLLPERRRIMSEWEKRQKFAEQYKPKKKWYEFWK